MPPKAGLPRPRRRTAIEFVACLVGAMLVPILPVHAQRAGVKMSDIRYVVFHRPGPGWLAGKTMFEQPAIREHIAHYRQWLDAGKLELGGPHPDAAGGGMMIPVAGITEDEVTRFAADDPAVKSGTLIADLRPWLIGMSRQ